MNEYEIMIQRFANDLELEQNNPEKYNISKLIRNNNKFFNEDIELLSKLAYLIRTGKAKVVIE